MKVQVINAEKRFSDVSIGVGRGKNVTDYTCSNCQTTRKIYAREFDNTLFNDDSVLSFEAIEIIDAAHQFERSKWEEFLDFHCKDCEMAVRVIYSPNEYRMACHNYLIKSVIEVR